MKKPLEQYFPVFREMELKEKIYTNASVQIFAADTVILQTDQYVKVLPLVIRGLLKVIREEEEGKEILLYYIRPGESCAVSLMAALNGKKSEVKAIAMEETEAILIPARLVQDWMRHYGSWQEFALELYHKRFDDLLETLDSVAFQNMDERLIKYLATKANLQSSNGFDATHQEIANDLGTSREVVSRLLKQMEKKAWITLKRNRIEFNKAFYQMVQVRYPSV